MTKAARHRESLLESAMRLFCDKGYAGTGLSEILSASGAPKGSLYHYFPGGKEDLAARAMEVAGERVEATLRQLAHSSRSPGGFISAYCELLISLLEESNFNSGCPITTTVLETVPASSRLSAVAREVFARWQAVVRSVYAAAGYSDPEADDRASLAIAAVEGALIQARVQRSAGPLKNISHLLGTPADAVSPVNIEA